MGKGAIEPNHPEDLTETALLEQFSAINNHLIDVQRDLAHKNHELAEQYAEYQRLVTESPIGLMVVDQSNILRFANISAQNLLGISEGELLGKSYNFPKSTDPAVGYQHKRSDGSLVLLDIQKRSILWNGHPMELISLYNEGDAFAANRMREHYVGVAAHDLRSPLAAISSYADLLIDELSGNIEADQLTLLERISHSSKGLLKMAESLLELAKLKDGRVSVDRSCFAIRDLIQEQLDLHHCVAIKKNSQIECSQTDDFTVFLDRNKMAEVVGNLICNALKFSPPGSIVKISATREDSWLVLDVADQGPGISEEDRSKLFQPFERLSAVPTAGETSTGLGLSIVHEFVNMHDGNIEVLPGHLCGTVFRVRIPIDAESSRK